LKYSTDNIDAELRAPFHLLGRLLPTDQQQLLLNSCFTRKDKATSFFQQWLLAMDDQMQIMRVNSQSIKGVSLLFNSAVNEHSLPIDTEVRSVLRLFCLKEDVRHKSYLKHFASILAAIQSWPDEVLVVGGIANLLTVYPDHRKRHCHGVDLLVAPHILGDVVASLASIRYSQNVMDSSAGSKTILLQHVDGLEVCIREQLFHPCVAGAGVNELRAQSRMVECESFTFRTPSLEMNLLFSCFSALYSSQSRYLRWVSDIYYLVGLEDAVNWQEFVNLARNYGLTLPGYLFLHFVHCRIGFSIPTTVIGELEISALQEKDSWQFALERVWLCSRRHLSMLVWLLGGRNMFEQTRNWLFKPSGKLLRWRGNDKVSWVVQRLSGIEIILNAIRLQYFSAIVRGKRQTYKWLDQASLEVGRK
jgi:hypothetical protein